MQFKIGQKAVIAIPATGDLAGREHNGTIVTVTGAPRLFEPWHRIESYPVDSVPAPYQNWVAMDCLKPLVEDGEYERFMDCVMKPVNLEPVAA